MSPYEHAFDHKATLSVSVEPSEALTVIGLHGALDYTTLAVFQERVHSVFADREPPGLVIDLSETEFCDSTGLSALVAVHRRLSRPETQLALAGAAGVIARLLRLTQLDQLFRCYETREAATAAVTELAAGEPPAAHP
ncbi:STAS domain-containing protein [Microbispora sp. RL4-1S]|uniref:Anti-sigma factor antagonist n=1 Tax=Microbispora oryzae TaxID=2806554 RepID=A0A940WNW9_9ACTN|nr:STAS domain-containing protein [Microbispora oryzae]MBP2708368.1 STAS domain-containing protein [Microbispora oryzae]